MTTLDLAAVRYPEFDDRPHEPGGGPDWQESYVFAWWDDNAGIGGFFRTGHETGRDAASALVGLVTADGLRYRRNLEDLPLTAADRKDDAFAAADGAYTVRFGDGTRRFEIHDGDCDLELDVDDFYPMYNYYAVTSGQEVGRQVGSDHYQVAGRVTGSVRIGGRQFTIDGLGHRDHSWGDRKWSAVLAHRWLAGSFGPELSFSLVTTLMPGGHMIRMGFVARDGEILTVRESDVAVVMEPDGTSHRAGYGTGVLPGGEPLRLDVEVIDGILITIRNLAVVEGIGRVTWGDRVGFCDLEVSNNPRQGTDPPPPCLRAVSEDGLSQRACPREAGEAPE
jgi:hypothetical protein